VLPEKYHRIDDVFLVRAEDLHLPKEEVGQGHGWIVKLEPILERDNVAHPQPVKKDVAVHPLRGPLEDKPPSPEGGEGDILLVAQSLD